MFVSVMLFSLLLCVPLVYVPLQLSLGLLFVTLFFNEVIIFYKFKPNSLKYNENYNQIIIKITNLEPY
jgi:hypothetical protein